MNPLYALLIMEILFLLLLIAVISVDCVSPGFITLSTFIISTLCIIWNEDYWNVNFSWETFVIVATGLFVITFVEVAVKIVSTRNESRIWIDRDLYRHTVPYSVSMGTKIIFLLLTGILTIIYILSVSRYGGSQGSLAAIGVVHNDVEIQVGTIPTIAYRLARIWCYTCIFVFVNNVHRCKEKVIKNLWLLIPVLFSCLCIFFSGVRSTYLYYILSYIFYTVMLQRFQKGWKKFKLRKYIIKIIILIFAFVFVFINSREIVKGHSFTSTGLEYITFYLGSPLHLFNKIVDNPAAVFGNDKGVIGVKSFEWLFDEMNKFGLTDISIDPTGFTAVGGDWFGGGNVYTIFSCPYYDFGFWGMLIFLIVFYGLFDLWYYKSFRYNKYILKNIDSLLLFGSYYYFIFMSFYTTMTGLLKIQTFFEAIICVLIFKFLTKVNFVYKIRS